MRLVGEIGVLLARLVRIAAAVVAAIILLAIVFVVLDADASNTIVSHVASWASTLVGPFDGIFHLSSHKATIAVDYGLAVVVYLVVAALLVRVLLTPAAAAVTPSATEPGATAP